jgi:hypothetical protein
MFLCELLGRRPRTGEVVPRPGADGASGDTNQDHADQLRTGAASVHRDTTRPGSPDCLPMRSALRCNKILTMDTDHSPFFSAPEELVGHLTSL